MEQSSNSEDVGGNISFTNLEWEKCILCKEDNSDTFQCPATKSTLTDKTVGYRSLIKTLTELHLLGSDIPFQLTDNATDEEITNFLFDHRAKCHRNYRLSYGSKCLKKHAKRNYQEMTLMKTHQLNILDQIKARNLQSLLLYVYSVMREGMQEPCMKHQHFRTE